MIHVSVAPVITINTYNNSEVSGEAFIFMESSQCRCTPCLMNNAYFFLLSACVSFRVVRVTCKRTCLTRSFWGDWTSPVLTGTTSLTQPRWGPQTFTRTSSLFMTNDIILTPILYFGGLSKLRHSLSLISIIFDPTPMRTGTPLP